MTINSGTVGMLAKAQSKITHTTNRETLSTNLATGEKSYSKDSFSATYEMATAGYDREQPQYSQNVRDKLDVLQRNESSELIKQLRAYLLNFRNRLSMMIGRRRFIGGENTLDLTETGGAGFSLWRKVEYTSYTYTEEASMDFQTTGKVITGDGRTIEFEMQVNMSREYVETSESITRSVEAIMTDPLVISLSSNPIAVSDQKWSFDIDGDGRMDNISMLSKGAGYLVYDKNEDGVINDGSELFGTRSGNGFADLAAYDEDGNGWIDEADSIYKKLSVWVKDDGGSDKLISLKSANVGAIYLGSMATDYAMKSDYDNTYNAQLRRSGMYLTEDGQARSVEQLDMVTALIS
ncbi:MAG: hypothetical protein ACI4D8_06730 [Wujia sp.]